MVEDVHSRLLAIAEALDSLEQHWALVGGLAVGVRAEPISTRDIDIVVAVRGDEEAERLVFELGRSGYRPLESGTIEQTAIHRLGTQRLMPPGGRGIVVDLLFATSGIEQEVVNGAERIEVLGLRLPVASRGHLIALKTLSLDDDTRPQDRLHLKELLACAERSDLTEAQEALTLIEERGCDREKDLQAELLELCQRHAPQLVRELDLGLGR